MRKYAVALGLLSLPSQTYAWLQLSPMEVFLFLLVPFLATFGFIILFVVTFFFWYRSRKKNSHKQVYKILFSISILWLFLSTFLLLLSTNNEILSSDRYHEETIAKLLSDEFPAYHPVEYISEGEFSVSYTVYDFGYDDKVEIRLTQPGSTSETITMKHRAIPVEWNAYCLGYGKNDLIRTEDECSESKILSDGTLLCTLEESYPPDEIEYCLAIDDVSIFIKYPKDFHINIEDFIGSFEKVKGSLDYPKSERSFERFMKVFINKLKFYF